MRKHRKKLGFLGLLLGITLSSSAWGVTHIVKPTDTPAPQSVQAQRTKLTKTSTSFSTEIATAFTYTESSEQCDAGNGPVARYIGNTSILVQRDNQANTVSAAINVEIIDQCASVDVETASGTIAVNQGGFAIDPKFNTETAKASGEILDQVSGQNVPVSFELTWIGDGNIAYDNSMDDFREGTTHSHSTDSRIGRDATVDGTITGESGTDYYDSIFFFPNQVMQHEQGTQTIKQ